MLLPDSLAQTNIFIGIEEITGGEANIGLMREDE